MQESKGNSKQLWSTVNEAFGKKAKSTNIPEMNGETSDSDITNEINNYFTSIASDLANKFSNHAPNRTEKLLHHPKLFLQQVEVSLIKKLILSLSMATAVGDDGVSPRIL